MFHIRFCTLTDTAMHMILKTNEACPKMYSYDFSYYSKDYIGEVMLESLLRCGDVLLKLTVVFLM